MAQTFAGVIGTLGITPSFVNNATQQAASTASTAAINQIWQGAGASFLGSAGQTLAGNLASSTVNVAMNSALGTRIAGPGGISINSGANFLASTVTPYITGTTAAGINQAINNSLKNAGPFAGVLSGVATGLVSQVFGGITNAITGASGGFGSSYRTFPGGSDSEPNSNYGKKAYTLGLNGRDVVFSIQPANQGPQTFGASSFSFPTSITTLPFNELTSMPLLAGNKTANILKGSAMVGGLSKSISKVSPSNFSTNFSLF